MPTPFVSVIIPVYNDSERLKLCLKTIEGQTYPKDLYEVIVVDNASEEDLKSLVGQFSQAKYAYEKQPGSYIARNEGISVARGEILAFTDADCIPDPDWIEKGVETLLNIPECGLVGGKIELFFKEPEKPTAVELFERIELNFAQKAKLEKYQFAMTANLFTFRSVIETIGDFDSSLKSGGDRQWGQRVFAAGYKQAYAEDARVAHPARHTFPELRKRLARLVGGGFDRLMSTNPSMVDIAKDVLGTFSPPFRSLYRAWKNDSLNSPYQKIQFISVMFYARYVVLIEKARLYLGGNTQRG